MDIKYTKNYTNNLFQDWTANSGNYKSRTVLILFRLASLIRGNIFLTILFLWYLILYRFFIEWILSIQINWHVKMGKGLRLSNGQGSIIESTTILGNHCTLRHHTTIGHKILPDGTFSLSPRLGHNVDIGSNVTIIGNIIIGDNVIIGAGAVITKNVPSNAVMVGNPGRILKMVYEHGTLG